MFKHILLPTDGSELSEAAIQKGIQFAKSINAEVTGFHVIPPFHIFSVRTGILADTKEQYESESKGRAEQFLGVVKKAAEKAGVRCDTECVTSSHPCEMIIKAAEKKGSHYDGIPWQKRPAGPADRQRDPQSFDPYQDTRASASLSDRNDIL